MKIVSFFLFLLMSQVSTAYAFDVTITPATPINAAPVASVERTEMAPVFGVPVAPERSVPAYAPQSSTTSIRSISDVPIPLWNPVKVSFCQSETGL